MLVATVCMCNRGAVGIAVSCRRRAVGRQAPTMLRNADRPEVLIFSSKRMFLTPGLSPLMMDAIKYGTALALVLDDEPLDTMTQFADDHCPEQVRVHLQLFSGLAHGLRGRPNPQCLSGFRY